MACTPSAPAPPPPPPRPVAPLNPRTRTCLLSSISTASSDAAMSGILALMRALFSVVCVSMNLYLLCMVLSAWIVSSTLILCAARNAGMSSCARAQRGGGREMSR